MIKIRANSYEAQLTPDELRDIHARLAAPGSSLAQIQQTAPPWRNGPLAGSKPGITTLSKIASRLRAEDRLINLQATEKLIQAAVKKLQANPKTTPELVDQLAQIITHDCLTNFAWRGDPGERIDQFRLLLRHQNQRLNQESPRDNLLEMLLRLETPKPATGGK